MNTWKTNLEETKKHYVDWWNGKGVVVNMWEHFQNGVKPHANVPKPKAPKDLNQKWFDPEWRAEYLDWYVAHSSLKADMLPVANAQLGPGSLAAILGGVFEGGEDTIWIHPNPDYSDELHFDPNHPNYLLHKKLLKACKEKAQGHYYVGMPDLMEGLDILAAIKGTDKVLMDTVMQPEVLEKQMQWINDVYFKVFDELYDIIREGDEMAFCYFSSWAPGKMSKLQCDISTMISVEDYRRFVQPFIAEQTKKIDYTLYHLDGVGATHHLPALLEIKDLNAIQWTPGVGEPQGGSPKWYDLYRRILNGGKSIMACWVTLEELRPLLENIGCDGVHLEMDFHNEDEVEQALEIVEQCKQSARSGASVKAAHTDDVDALVDEIIAKVDSDVDALVDEIIAKVEGEGVHFDIEDTALAKISRQRILVLDGAMGTMIQRYALKEEDFRGERFAGHACELKGCNDLLCITRPDIITDIHKKYLAAGADIIETNTFNAQRISLGDYRMEEHVREINLAACKLAREAADEFTKKNPLKPRFVAGSVGPTPKTLSMAHDASQPGWRKFDAQVLSEAYTEQIEALLEGGVDAILIETIFDIENAKVAIDAAHKTMARTGKRVPLMLSATVSMKDGHNMLGQSVIDFYNSLSGDDIFSVGLNCLPDAVAMAQLLQKLAATTKYRISVYPNAGHPDANGNYKKSPKMLQGDLWRLAENHVLNIIGGCCGTTDGHIAEVARLAEPIEGLFLTPHDPLNDTVVLTEEKTETNHEEHGEMCDCPTCDCPTCNPTAGKDKAEEKTENETNAADAVFDAIVGGNQSACATATEKCIASGMAPADIINGQMIRAMGEIGKRFEEGKAFVPQLLMAGRAMKSGLALLKPLMAGDASISAGKIVIGTVKGDLHDIGKNLVASMLEGSGFEVINIGIDVAADKFVEAVKETKADILCMSALLTTTMTYMKDVLDALEQSGIRKDVKVMVGGAPVSQSFADEIGADGYSDNANSAVALAKRLMGT
ncbi:MAG: homocysteine S-methyltransferase family protein [Prevotella sp.]|nr:homocysteine S-methyltransferase family protein [Prevotella sp.]